MGSTTQHGRGGRPLRSGAHLRALRAGRKALVTSVGAAVLLLGLILLPLPGPGMLVVGLGLGLLSTEYRWPARLARRLRAEAEVLRERLAERRARRRSPAGLQRSGPTTPG